MQIFMIIFRQKIIKDYEEFKDYTRAAMAWNQLRVGYPDSPYVTRGLKVRLKIAERRAERDAMRKRRRNF